MRAVGRGGVPVRCFGLVRFGSGLVSIPFGSVSFGLVLWHVRLCTSEVWGGCEVAVCGGP